VILIIPLTPIQTGEIKHGVPHGSILGPLLFFLLHINDLPKTINDNAEIILFADDTSVIITSFMSIILQSYVHTFINFKSLKVTICFGQYGHHQVLKYIY
jgi:hypothetical protein